MTGIDRRFLLAGLGAAAAAPAYATINPAQPRDDGMLAFGEDAPPPVDFHAHIAAPVRIRAVELWRTPADVFLVRVVSEDGVEGVVRGSTKAEETIELFRLFVARRLVGEDARDIHSIIERRYPADYEYAGIPYWSSWGQAEVAVWDLLGKTARKRCCDMMGPVLHERIPIYLSSNRRDTTPEVEIAHLQERIEETGARAIKLKVGRRMGRNTDTMPGRSEAVIALARRTFGDDMVIYADANGAYDAPTAIEVSRMLANYGVDIFEEPCPFEDFEMMRQAAEGAAVKVAGGENDYAFERWRWYIANRVFDVLQPDPMYGGGTLRCLAVQRMAGAAGILYAPHFPRNNADTAPMLHLCAVASNLYGYQEYRSRPDTLDYAHAPELSPRRGELRLPRGPGWGIEYDPAIWTTATKVAPL
jgi:L-alanine-DL-glutamate epimerase-like enolase superfamily enzyme